jgi:Domain of unknown function (DUF4965)/Domain of unknown function (DUF1793)/Domain of unknown function (DUF5127)/Domain of unknown function (DUF4964)
LPNLTTDVVSEIRQNLNDRNRLRLPRMAFLGEGLNNIRLSKVGGVTRTLPTYWVLVFILLSLFAGSSRAGSQERPPAVPLVAYDPYFSIWSMSDKLTDSNTRHWTGTEQPLTGLARIDGSNYRFMGATPRQVPAMPQVTMRVTALHTVYSFEAAGVSLTVTFFTPDFPRDLDTLSRPVTYLSWAVRSTDGRSHSVNIFLDVSPRVAVNSDDEEVTWGRFMAPGLEVLSVGSRDQRILSRAGDNLRIDWGYFYLAVPKQEDAMLVASSDAISSFLSNGSLPDADEMEMPRQPRSGAAHLAVALPMNVSGSQPSSRHVLLACNEIYSVEYLERKLRPYWQRNGQTPSAMLALAENKYSTLEERGMHFDEALASDLEHVGGKAYAELGALAYRQTLAAHGFAADADGTPMLFPKENFSNGCISTVDVLYPSSPFFLFFNPALLGAQLKPVLEYAALPRWKWPFAPHDLGTYPLADGQVYGGGERTEEDQMPIEESGNMLIMMDALGRAEGNWHLAEEYWPQLTKWADYLRAKGLDPENQLSTDDFAGHLAHNANLSIKAIEGIAAYAQIAKALGKSDIAEQNAAAAKQMAEQWQTMAKDGDHYKLAFDKPGTWSQKYNLVWDQLLELNLFPSSIRQTEVAFYLKHMNEYGLPLDNRADYTKLDWELWTGTLASDPGQFHLLMDPIGKWINETPSRVPLTDWYDTKTGKMIGFQARSVVGGTFIKALADKNLERKWREFQP